MDAFVFFAALAHMFYTPFTKVEESFNLQAMHDILYYRHNISQYDHVDFPGVVPRTFIGPLSIAILSSPLIMLLDTLRLNKFWAQYVVRLVLAAVVAHSWTKLRDVIMKIFHVEVRIWFTMITISQFHFIFYMSRPLPNIMALPLVLHALAFWLQSRHKPFIICSGMAILIFRFELIIFLGLLLAFELVSRRLKVDRLLRIGVPAGLIIISSTVLIDSYFWQRTLWPEGEVLWYNTVLNKSSNWGTSPFLWYFYSAIPRAMTTSLFFVPIGFYLERRVRGIVFAALAFVLIYSILPHKELRFIIYIFPVLNLAAATACNRLWINGHKSWWQGLLATAALGHLLLNFLVTLFLLVVSSTNYPGGVALAQLHRIEALTPNVSVHIDNLAAQSGVSRFLQLNSHWQYCKNESMSYLPEELDRYTHLLVEAKNRHNSDLWTALLADFEAIEYVECFNSIGIQYNSLLPLRIKTKPCTVILKRRKSTKMRENQVKNVKEDVSIKEADSEPELNEKLSSNEVETKEINFQELHSLAMGQSTPRKGKATKQKLRQLIEQHFRSKGRKIENDSEEEKREKSQLNLRQTVKAIIKQERIKQIIEEIASMDLMKVCQLDKVSTKECLKNIIDGLDLDDK